MDAVCRDAERLAESIARGKNSIQPDHALLSPLAQPALMALCAAEMSALDLMSRSAGVSLLSFLNIEPINEFIVSPVVPLTDPLQSARTAAMFSKTCRGTVKVKARASDGFDWLERMLDVYRRIDPNPSSKRLRLDFNQSMPRGDAALCEKVVKSMGVPIAAIEEATPDLDIETAERLSLACDTLYFFDESCTSFSDIEVLCRRENPRVGVNIRISKMGGLRRSLAALEKCASSGIPLGIGCHTGEHSALSRAWLALASAANQVSHFFEGCYGTHVIQDDAFTPCLSVGADGRIVDLYDYHGLGVQASR
jgi:L-alanine-DL-glutamate epimerase-like enolase superfamily enzyme